MKVRGSHFVRRTPGLLEHGFIERCFIKQGLLVTRALLRNLMAAAVLFGSVITENRAQAQPEQSEYRLMASYLLLFTRHVEWPAQTFASAESPLIVTILGTDPFGSQLDEALRDRTSHGRRLLVRRVATAEEALGSHVVFISRYERRHQPLWLAAMRKHPILTVAETDTAIAQGAIVVFDAEWIDGRTQLRFDICWPPIARASLKIGAPMLQAARQIHQDLPP